MTIVDISGTSTYRLVMARRETLLLLFDDTFYDYTHLDSVVSTWLKRNL